MDFTDRKSIMGGALVGLGALFLIAQVLDMGRYGWPLFIMVPGLMFFVGMASGGKKTAALAIPGSIISTVGLILFYQNLTGRFETWAYAWALIPAAVGAGMIIQGRILEKDAITRKGMLFAQNALYSFLGFAIFFEFIIGIGGRSHGLSNLMMPIVLIAGGAYLLMRDRLPQEVPTSPPEAPSEAADGKLEETPS